MIGIVDYKMGNVGSIVNMIKKIGEKYILTSDPDKLRNTDKLILPGVGKFDMGISNLEELGLKGFLDDEVGKRGKYILGICLGMQLMTQNSEEGKKSGLGYFNAKTLHFSKLHQEFNQRIPHMGWNSVQIIKNSRIVHDLPELSKFYFVHSYYVKADNVEDIIMNTTYSEEFCSGIMRDNMIGVQFHPEKSHKYGLALLNNFVKL